MKKAVHLYKFCLQNENFRTAFNCIKKIFHRAQSKFPYSLRPKFTKRETFINAALINYYEGKAADRIQTIKSTFLLT